MNQKLFSPVLTICVPTFERSSHLKLLLNCLLPQLTPEIELLIGDNCSEDKTRELVSSFIRSHPDKRIDLIVQDTNVGFDKNVIALMNKASGRYCWLVSDDDLIYPEILGKIIDVIKSHDKLALILVNYNRIKKSSSLKTPETMIDISDDLLFDDFDLFFFKKTPKAYMKFLGANIIFLSINIVERELWLQVESECNKFIGFNMIHLFIISKVITLCPKTYFFATPGISYLAKNARNWDNDIYSDYLSYYPSYLKEVGYDQVKVNKNLYEWPASGLNKRERIIKAISKLPFGTRFLDIILDIKRKVFKLQ